jgi:hypothetical protein
MSDRFDTDDRPRDVSGEFLPLPRFLAVRKLRAGEDVTWVRGPRSNPAWEPYFTHPALFLVALALGAACLVMGRLITGNWGNVLPALAAAVVIFGSIFVLGICSAHFTRLVVTSHRLLILQGYEVVRAWDIDDLPRSLIRYGRRATGEQTQAVDLESLKTMFGTSSGQFADAKTILAFGKQLGQIKARENDPRRPGDDR